MFGGSMIHRQILPLILIAALFLCPTLSFAQQNNSAEPNQKVNDTELKEKAYGLLESLATQTSTLQSAENRARIGSNIAGSLWSHDDKRARTILISVAEDIRSGLQLGEEDNPKDETTFMVFLHLRSDTVERIAKHDPELAFEFLKTTEPVYKDHPPSYLVEREHALTMRLAKQIAAANPDLALKLGRTSLAQGFSEDLLSLLRQLLRKNRDQGLTLYKETVRKIRDAKFTDDLPAMEFALHLAYLKPPLADESTFREFINTLLTIALNMKCDKQDPEIGVTNVCYQLASIMTQMESVDPVRAAKLKHIMPAIEDAWEWESGAMAELEELIEGRDYDEILALAQKYPAIEATIKWRAFELARTSGDLERAKKIATAYDENPEAQKHMLEQIEIAKNAETFGEAELKEINEAAETITDARKRFEFLVAAAVRVGARNRTDALKLLDQATQTVEFLKPGKDRTIGAMILAEQYAKEKSDRGFALMESVMPKLNELIDAAMKLDGFDTNYVRDGEWNMSAAGNLGEVLTELSRNAGYFAWCDFDRATNMAAQFERPEIRMMAQLKLAQAIVAGPPKRSLMNTSTINY
jgi:hypothetical protein